MNKEDAISMINKGEVIALPTETVYGLAASILYPEAIRKIFSLKKRPVNNPLIVHVAHPEDILGMIKEVPQDFLTLAKTFWPGPLTVVLPVDCNKIPTEARAGLNTAAFRVPSHPILQDILKKTGPLVMPSANLSGKPSPTSPDHILNDFGRDFPVLDGGICECGIESTVVDFNQNRWQIIRLGYLSAEQFEPFLNYCPAISLGGKQPLCPGQQYRHYAPSTKLYLTKEFWPNQVVLGYSDRIYPTNCTLYDLGASNSPEVVMKRLYAMLRKLDEDNILKAFVDVDIPKNGLWKTVLERLKRASQP